MPVIVRIPTPLRSITGGRAEIEAQPGTLDSILADLEAQFPGLRERLVDETGEYRRFMNVYVNEEDVRFLKARAPAIGDEDVWLGSGDANAGDGDVISIVPAIAGG